MQRSSDTGPYWQAVACCYWCATLWSLLLFPHPTPPQGHAPEVAPVLAACAAVLNSWCSSRAVLLWATFTGSCSNSKDCSTSTTATGTAVRGHQQDHNPLSPQKSTHAFAALALGETGAMQAMCTHYAHVNAARLQNLQPLAANPLILMMLVTG